MKNFEFIFSIFQGMGNFEPEEIESSNKPGEGGLAYELPPDLQVIKI